MMRMYAITVFKSFQGHVVGPPTQSTGTILDQLFVVRPVDFARLATFRSPCFFLRILLDLFISSSIFAVIFTSISVRIYLEDGLHN